MTHITQVVDDTPPHTHYNRDVEMTATEKKKLYLLAKAQQQAVKILGAKK